MILYSVYYTGKYQQNHLNMDINGVFTLIRVLGGWNVYTLQFQEGLRIRIIIKAFIILGRRIMNTDDA